jgi:CheY-like chemotaxis protein
MDIGLRGINGIEALKLIRCINEHYSGVPVIAITAYAMKGDKEKFLSLGFTHYLSKPFQQSELLSLLSAIFQGSYSNE